MKPFDARIEFPGDNLSEVVRHFVLRARRVDESVILEIFETTNLAGTAIVEGWANKEDTKRQRQRVGRDLLTYR